ncbi:hypothetical protein ScPMuIL_013216 [Solemya velum]
MPTCCCVPGCSNRGGVAFPKDAVLRAKWIQAVRRESSEEKHKLWQPGPSSVVCHNHFTASDYITETSYGTTPTYRKRKADAVPSIFLWTSGPNGNDREERLISRNKRQRTLKAASVTSESDLPNEFICDADTNVAYECEVSSISQDDTQLISDSTSSEVHVCDCKFCNHCNHHKTDCEDAATNTDTTPMMSVERFIHNNEGMLFYTGLATYNDFRHVLYSLGDASYDLNYLYYKVTSLSIENQLFLTLIKLRQHTRNFELSWWFGISPKGVENIWITWVNFMYYQWKEIDFWPSRDLVKFYSPSDFFSKFPTTRVIIDGTECPVMKPKPPVAQQATYSTYKNRNTIKVLVGCTPGGAVSYISDAYGGSVSDRQIVERSAMMNMCDPGDSIMSDKGFNVQDLFAHQDVAINIPTFFRKKNRMCGKTVLRDRKISSKRVHIERIIGLAKTFRILKEPLNATETKLASEITFICFMLCNFRRCIVPGHA